MGNCNFGYLKNRDSDIGISRQPLWKRTNIKEESLPVPCKEIISSSYEPSFFSVFETNNNNTNNNDNNPIPTIKNDDYNDSTSTSHMKNDTNRNHGISTSNTLMNDENNNNNNNNNNNIELNKNSNNQKTSTTTTTPTSTPTSNKISVSLSQMRGWREYMEDYALIVENVYRNNNTLFNDDTKDDNDHSHFNHHHDLDLNDKDAVACLAIFDGHQGKHAAEFLKKYAVDAILNINNPQLLYNHHHEQKLHQEGEKNDAMSSSTGMNNSSFSSMKNNNIKSIISPLTIEKNAKQAFIELDEDLRACNVDNSGTTACMVFISNKYLMTVNCGDSRAIIGRGCDQGDDQCQQVEVEVEGNYENNENNIMNNRNIDVEQLTLDHRPDNKWEQRRIKRNGGDVINTGTKEDPIFRIIRPGLKFSMAVSRTIGDFDFKNNEFYSQSHAARKRRKLRRMANYAHAHAHNNGNGTKNNNNNVNNYNNKDKNNKPEPSPYMGVVTCIPDIEIYERTNLDRWLVIASDGIYDIFTNKDIIFLIENWVTESNNTLTTREISELLVKRCFELGGLDNLSVIVADLRVTPCDNIDNNNNMDDTGSSKPKIDENEKGGIILSASSSSSSMTMMTPSPRKKNATTSTLKKLESLPLPSPPKLYHGGSNKILYRQTENIKASPIHRIKNTMTRAVSFDDFRKRINFDSAAVSVPVPLSAPFNQNNSNNKNYENMNNNNNVSSSSLNDNNNNEQTLQPSNSESKIVFNFENTRKHDISNNSIDKDNDNDDISLEIEKMTLQINDDDAEDDSNNVITF